MKNYNLLGVCLVCLLSACSFKKVTEIQISNNNSYPISVTVKTNNIEQRYTAISPLSKTTKEYDWSTITKEDGQWVFFITNEHTSGIDSFSHGYYTHGELSNFAEVISEGSELKVRISE